MKLHSGKTKDRNGKWTRIEDVSPIKIGDFSIAILVYQRVTMLGKNKEVSANPWCLLKYYPGVLQTSFLCNRVRCTPQSCSSSSSLLILYIIGSEVYFAKRLWENNKKRDHFKRKGCLPEISH